MAARGNDAKEAITKKIIECFGQNQCFVHDKKIYINTTEGGEPVQICLALTCPKMMVSPNGGETVAAAPAKPSFSAGFDFESMGMDTPAPTEFKPADITPEEKATVQDLMRRLGL